MSELMDAALAETVSWASSLPELNVAWIPEPAVLTCLA